MFLCPNVWVVAVGGLVSATVPRILFHAAICTTLVCRVLNILAVGLLRGVETLAYEIVKPLVLAW